MDLFAQQERRRKQVAANAQNRARQAAYFGKVTSTGQGPLDFEDELDFVLAFTQEPFVQYGSYVDADDLRLALGMDDDTVPTPYPLTSGHVIDWHIDSRGLYVGAFVGVRVYFPPDILVAADVSVTVEHHFKFEAIAIKDVAFGGS